MYRCIYVYIQPENSWKNTACYKNDSPYNSPAMWRNEASVAMGHFALIKIAGFFFGAHSPQISG